MRARRSSRSLRRCASKGWMPPSWRRCCGSHRARAGVRASPSSGRPRARRSSVSMPAPPTAWSTCASAPCCIRRSSRWFPSCAPSRRGCGRPALPAPSRRRSAMRVSTCCSTSPRRPISPRSRRSPNSRRRKISRVLRGARPATRRRRRRRCGARRGWSSAASPSTCRSKLSCRRVRRPRRRSRPK